VIALLFRVLVDVRLASHLGAALAGDPAFGDELVAIAKRESRLDPLVGIHEGDAWASARVRPAGCAGGGFATRGVHGLMFGYSVRHLPDFLRCSPWVLDIPLVSAIVATRRARSWQCRQTRRCVAWMECERR